MVCFEFEQFFNLVFLYLETGSGMQCQCTWIIRLDEFKREPTPRYDPSSLISRSDEFPTSTSFTYLFFRPCVSGDAAACLGVLPQRAWSAPTLRQCISYDRADLPLTHKASFKFNAVYVNFKAGFNTMEIKNSCTCPGIRLYPTPRSSDTRDISFILEHFGRPLLL